MMIICRYLKSVYLYKWISFILRWCRVFQASLILLTKWNLHEPSQTIAAIFFTLKLQMHSRCMDFCYQLPALKLTKTHVSKMPIVKTTKVSSWEVKMTKIRRHSPAFERGNKNWLKRDLEMWTKMRLRWSRFDLSFSIFLYFHRFVLAFSFDCHIIVCEFSQTLIYLIAIGNYSRLLLRKTNSCTNNEAF